MTAKKKKGRSLHIGLNSVNPAHYQGWDGKLAGCENDARDMQTIANSQGFTTTLMLTDAATSAAVIEAIGRAAQELSAGDTFLLTYSGHRALPDAQQSALLTSIARLIDVDYGGQVVKRYLTELRLAQRVR